MRLRAGDIEAELEGGALLSVTGLRHRGTELLMAPAALPAGYRVHGARTGITLLHPWANRLGAETFAVGDVTVDVGASGDVVGRDGAGLPIHGVARPGTWEPERDDEATATARAAFTAQPAFPWPHDVEVRVAVAAPAGLRVTTTVRATADAPVPVALGWHPYFALPAAPRPAWRLDLPALAHLGLDARGLPDGSSAAQPAESAALADRAFDDGYTEVAEGATLALSDGTRRVEVAFDAGFPAAQVFAPGDADVVALEPMVAPTDALRTGAGLRWARPGAPYVATFTVTVADDAA